MIILSKDCKIVFDGHCYTVYALKSSKELKESEPKEKYRVHGYYNSVKNAFFGIIRWRLHKKYPFKESPKEFKNYYYALNKSDELLSDFLNNLDQPINNYYEKFVKNFGKL